MIGSARNQYRSFADVQTTVENKIERAAKRPTALIIGKNIVGVVLQCNNYEIVDLGVMAVSYTHLAVYKRQGLLLVREDRSGRITGVRVVMPMALPGS